LRLRSGVFDDESKGLVRAIVVNGLLEVELGCTPC
jgi:hypothetical protein